MFPKAVRHQTNRLCQRTVKTQYQLVGHCDAIRDGLFQVHGSHDTWQFGGLYAHGRESSGQYYHSVLSRLKECTIEQRLVYFSGKMNNVLAEMITPAAVRMLPFIVRTCHRP